MNGMKELKLQAAIDQTIGVLVAQAEKLIDERSDKIKQIEANQLRNVMAVANSAPHPAVVTNFIHYQMGRSGPSGRAWKETRLGEAVIAIINDYVRKLAQEVVEETRKAVQDKDYGDIDAVQIQLTRLLLGFMYRRHVYVAS